MVQSASDVRYLWNRQVGHAHFAQRALSRRYFLGTTVLGGGAAATASLWAPAIARASAVSGGTPTPIPETLDGTPFHIQLPAPDTELSLINNFNGVLGVADISGVGTGTGGTNLTYEVDLRFMSGRFIGTDGNLHQGTFGFVWLDVYVGPAAPDFSNQIHDFDPGIHPFPNGLFWVVTLSPDNVDFNLGQGTASLRVSGQSIRDFGSIPNALSNGPSVPAVASYDVKWSGIAQRGTFSSSSQHFALEPFVRTGATVNWTGSSSKGSFTSTAITKVNFAQLAHETNGVFFDG